MSWNTPDDWGMYYDNCSRCGHRTHASEGYSCPCDDEAVDTVGLIAEALLAAHGAYAGSNLAAEAALDEVQRTFEEKDYRLLLVKLMAAMRAAGDESPMTSPLEKAHSLCETLIDVLSGAPRT